MHTAQLIDWSPEDNESNYGTTTVDSIYQQLNTLPKDDQEELMTTANKKQMLASKLAKQAGLQMGDGRISAKYHHHLSVFSEEASHRFPEPHIWDHAIELKPGAPSLIPGKVYQLTQDEQKALLKFVQEQQAKGYICPSKSPYAAPFFFIKKMDSKL